MGNPRHHRKGGRVTPKGTRPPNRPSGPRRSLPEAVPSGLELLLRDAGRMASGCTDIEEADGWASAIQSVFRRIGPAEGPPLEALDVLLVAADRGDTAAAVLAGAIAVYGPSPGRRRAHDLYRRLVSGGAAVPEWVDDLGDVTPRRAMLFTDAWEDEHLVWIDFARPDGTVRGLGVEIDRLGGGTARGFVHGVSIDAILEASGSDPAAVTRPIGLADAGAMIAAGLKNRDVTVPVDGADGGEDRYRFDEDLRALVDQRIGLLPPGGDAARPRRLTKREVDRVVREFVRRCGGAARQDAEGVVDKIRMFNAACHDGDPLRWSPLKIGWFLAGWIPWKVITDDEFHDAVEDVFPRWLEFAAERRGLAADLLAVNLSVARESFEDMRRNADDPSRRSPTTNIVREMLADGIDPSDPASSEAVQAWIDQYNARPRRERY